MFSKLAFYKDYLREIWTDGHVEKLSQFMAETTHARGLVRDVEMTRDDIEQIVPALHAHLSNITHDVRHSYEADDYLHVLMTVTGKSKVSGKQVKFEGQSFIRFANYKMSTMHEHYDLIGLFSQLGFLPEDTVALCLSGEKIS